MEKAPDFSFSSDEVLKTLRERNGRLEYQGSATSHFQAEPLIYDAQGNPIITSDWELEVIKKDTDTSTLPRFLPNKEKYIDRSAELGENMFRFSLDFARLCPSPGQFNEGLMADYVKTLALIRARGQEPMLTLYHWPMPRYLLEENEEGQIVQGGWEHPEVAKHFRFYIDNVVRFLGDDDRIRQILSEEGFDQDAQDKFLGEGLARYFITINEPNSIILPGYIGGVFPPFKKGRVDLIRGVLGRLVEAHDIAFNELKLKGQDRQVGVAHAWTYFDGILGGLAHELVNKKVTDQFERTGEYSDFLGLQYYFRMTIPLLARVADRHYGDHPAFGDVYPPGLYELMKKMHATYPNKEIFLTEFGFSDTNDRRRPYWILETARYVIEALKAGIPIKGMLLWSMVNNYEWAEGMDQKFGLFDESELSQPMTPDEGHLRSWQIWQSLLKALASPTPESLAALQKHYQTAKQQFESAEK